MKQPLCNGRHIVNIVNHIYFYVCSFILMHSRKLLHNFYFISLDSCEDNIVGNQTCDSMCARQSHQ